MFLFFQHERTPYLQIISPDLSVTVFVTLHLWALKNNCRNAPRTSVEKHLLGVFTVITYYTSFLALTPCKGPPKLITCYM